MPLSARARDLAIGGGILVAAGGAYLLVGRAASAGIVTTPASTPTPIPVDVILPAGAGAGGGSVEAGGGLASAAALTPADTLTLADVTSAFAAAVAALQSEATAGSLGTQAPVGGTAGVGSQVPAGEPRTTGPGPSASVAANVVAAELPGAAALSAADLEYWQGKLDEAPPVAQTYDPATSLAQWLEIAATGTYLPNASGAGLSILPGTPRYDAAPVDIRIGLANAEARAVAAGVTTEDLAATQARLAAQLAAGNYAVGGTGYIDKSLEQINAASFALTGGNTAFTTEQLSYINLKGGYTVEVLTALKNDPAFAKLGA